MAFSFLPSEYLTSYMGYQNRMTGHGFRTLASTILNEKGYPSDVIERQLAHEDEDKIRSAYNRAEYLLERKKMIQDYADWLDSVQKDSGKNVISLKSKKPPTKTRVIYDRCKNIS